MTLDDYRHEVDALARHATWDHLPAHLADVSRPVSLLLRDMALMFRDSPSSQALIGLQRLIEAKDAFVRAAIEDGDE